MANQISPTKGNLLAVKKSLELAISGYELLDKKRNILIKEASAYVDKAKELENTVNKFYADAYNSLSMANLQNGVVDNIAKSAPKDNSLKIEYKSIMGIDVPSLTVEKGVIHNFYGYYETNADLDDAYIKFNNLKEITVKLAEIENCVFRISNGIKKTQKRANALKNIIIPKYQEQIAQITMALEEKEREEFTRLKVIKNQLENK